MPKRPSPKRYRPYPANMACPCDSGLLYGQCCKQKHFRFEVDRRGRIRRRIEIHPRLKSTLEEAALEFTKILGRKPGPKDPVLFNHWLSGEEDFWQHARNIGGASNIPEQLIFAWRRSGFVVGEHSRQMMPENEYQEWKDAIDEYFLIKESGLDPFHVFTYLSGKEYELYKDLVERFDHVIIAMGFALTGPKRFDQAADYFRYLFIQRTVSSMRTIKEMYKNRYDGDCLSITRTLYEAYLRMKLLRLDPTSAERFEAKLAYQTGLYKTTIRKNGKPNYDVVFDPKTGNEFRIAISNGEILDISDFSLETELYYDIYPLLSEFVHPDLIGVAIKSVTATGGKASYEEDPIRAAVLVASVCVLPLLEISVSNFLRKQTKRDVRHVLGSLGKALRRLITTETVLSRAISPPSIYRLLGFDVEVAKSK